jgi:ABC-type glutathione transport system ATPase component
MFILLVGGACASLWLLLTDSTTALSLALVTTRRFVPPRALRQPLSPLRCAAKAKARSVQYVPCTLLLDQVTVSYPDNPWRRLTSSVPYREWALNVSLAVQSSDLLLMTGDSSSGKSTLLQLIVANTTATTATTVQSSLSRKLLLVLPIVPIPTIRLFSLGYPFT